MRKVWLSVAGAVAAAGVLAACGGADSGEGAGQGGAAASSSAAPRAGGAAEVPAASKDVKVVRSGVEDHATWGPGAYVVAYEITNHGAGAADYFVGFEFLDRDGDVLGSTGVTADKLGSGKTNRGDTAPLEAEITNGKMSDIRSVRVSQVDRSAVSGGQS